MKYDILPFQFKKFGDVYLLVNAAGEYLFLSHDDFDSFTIGTLDNLSDAYKVLKSKHFLTVNSEKELVTDMLAIKLRTRKAYIMDFTSLHMMVLTLRCNCMCRYCHASSIDYTKKNFDMTWDIAKKTIEMIMQSPSPSIKIEFQGGEPLLNWDILKQSVLYAEILSKVAKKNLEFTICTNLVDISDSQIIFLKKHKVHISTSLDGTQEMHDLNRPSRVFSSSFGQFVGNVQRIREKFKYYDISALLTITNNNIDHLHEVIDEYVKLGFHTIFLRPLNPYGNAVVNKDELGYSTQKFIDAYRSALTYILELNKNGCELVECFTLLLLTRILTPFATGFVDLQSPSGAGISGVIYNYDGKIYPADEGRMLARMGDDYFCMGNVNEPYRKVFGGNLIRDIVKYSCVENMPICSECVYQQYCGADVIRNYLETKDIVGNRLNNDFCNRNRNMLDYLFKLLQEGDKDTFDIFWAWITRRSYGMVKIDSN